MSKTALITGASSGIGEEFARIHAAQGGNLVLVARRQEKLESLGAELRKAHGVDVHILPMDLNGEEASQHIFDWVQDKNIGIDFLINNAGFGGRGKFHERDWQDDRSMIQVNIVALTALSRLFLPGFVARNSGRILNVSSTASLMPGPLQAVYYATKAYVTFFGNALAEELHDTNVTVTTLMPGATESEFAATSDMDKTDLFAKTASANSVAKAGYEAMLGGKLDVIAGVPTSMRIMMSMFPFMPKKALPKQVRQMQEVDE